MATGCDGEPLAVVLVTVEARPTVQQASALEVVVSNAGDIQGATFFLTRSSFPLTFTITTGERRGDLHIELSAVQELETDRLVRARGSATTTIAPGRRTDAQVMLEPHDFVATTTVAGDQATTFVPDGRNGRQIGATADGSFLIAFTSGCNPMCETRARWFDPHARPALLGGAPSASDFLVAQTGNVAPVIATAALGDRALLAWSAAQSTPPGSTIHAAVLATGETMRDSVVIESGGSTNPVENPYAAILGTGELLVTWTRRQESPMVRGRLLDRDGVPAINPITGDDGAFDIGLAGPGPGATSVATGEGRGFVAAWSEGGNVAARFFDAEGRPWTDGPVYLASHEDAVVRGVQLAWDGEAAVVAWDAAFDAGSRPEASALFVGRFLPPEGAPAGEPVMLRAAGAGVLGVPDVAVRDDGVTAVVWHECSGGDGTGCDVLMSVLDPAGTPVGEPFVATTTTIGDQREPAVAASGEAFLIVWTDGSAAAPDTSGTAVRARAVYPTLGPTRPGSARGPILEPSPGLPRGAPGAAPRGPRPGPPCELASERACERVGQVTRSGS